MSPGFPPLSVKPGGLVSSARKRKPIKHHPQHRLRHCRSQDQGNHPKPSEPLTPREQFAQLYGFTLPPLPPHENPDAGYPSSRASFAFPMPTVFPSLVDDNELLAKFHKLFLHSRTQLESREQHTPKRCESSNLAPGGPVKQSKARYVSNTLSESVPSKRTPSFRKHPQSSVVDHNKIYEIENFTPFTIKRPTFKTRDWSYDGFLTYPTMKPPPKIKKCIIKKIVDGEERDEEVQVEVFEEPKRLFHFAQKVVLL